jgi:hypothetical protein
MLKRIAGFALAIGLAALAGCSGSPSSSSAPGTGRVIVRLTDAPADYDAVNLVVDGVTIHRGDDDGAGGWETLSDDTITVDLLTLRNGVFMTLADIVVPAGHYTQVRLHLGEGSNVVVDGVTHPLTVPSGMQSGYKLVGEFDVPDGGLLDLMLDFDAARSIHQTGNGRYMLRPTVRVIPTSTAGSITGHVVPGDVPTAVTAVAGGDTVQTTVTLANGLFTLGALAGGTYDVLFDPPAGYRDTTLTGVTVTSQVVTDVGNVALTPE